MGVGVTPQGQQGREGACLEWAGRGWNAEVCQGLSTASGEKFATKESRGVEFYLRERKRVWDVCGCLFWLRCL
jgi:hypothetical protein